MKHHSDTLRVLCELIITFLNCSHSLLLLVIGVAYADKEESSSQQNNSQEFAL